MGISSARCSRTTRRRSGDEFHLRQVCAFVTVHRIVGKRLMVYSTASWKNSVCFDEYDFVVIGTGCTALAFVQETLRLDPHKKILCLERGGTSTLKTYRDCQMLTHSGFLLPTHFQNLSAPFKSLIGGDSETYPWTLSEETHQSVLGFCHGYYPFFGGRSLFWSGWCPQPSLKAFRGFPESMRKAAADPMFWRRGKEVLNVTSTAELEDEAFGALQRQLSDSLDLPFEGVPSVEVSEPAMLAGAHRKGKKTSFSKFCAAESLLSLVDRQKQKALAGQGSKLDIRLNCITESIIMDGDRAVGLETSQGLIRLNQDQAKVVLCAGVRKCLYGTHSRQANLEYIFHCRLFQIPLLCITRSHVLETPRAKD